VAVITLRGRGSSALLKLDQLGLWQLRRFTGAYDEQANPMWTPVSMAIEFSPPVVIQISPPGWESVLSAGRSSPALSFSLSR
jgi:hypothetical protein